MTSTIRCILLVSACSLGSACEAPKPAKQESVTAVSPAPAAKLEAPSEALTATAPEKLKSVADLPATAPAEEKTSEPAPSEQPKLAEQPNEDNFDRPLTIAEVKVERFVLASDVKAREPVGESDTFSTDARKIFAFVQLANPGAPYAFRVHWEPVEGPAVPYGVKLSVPTAERFRTWSWTAIERKPGRYRAVLRTLTGEEIASRELLITAAGE